MLAIAKDWAAAIQRKELGDSDWSKVLSVVVKVHFDDKGVLFTIKLVDTRRGESAIYAQRPSRHINPLLKQAKVSSTSSLFFSELMPCLFFNVLLVDMSTFLNAVTTGKLAAAATSLVRCRLSGILARTYFLERKAHVFWQVFVGKQVYNKQGGWCKYVPKV